MSAEKIEDIILEGLVANDEFCRQVLHHLSLDYYSDTVDKFFIKEIKKFYDTHNQAPTKKILKLAIEDADEFKPDEYTRANDKIVLLGAPEENKEWLIKRTEQFCKDRAIYNSIVQSIKIIDGKSTKYGKDAIPGLLSDALSISFDKTIGHDFFDDSEKRFDSYHLKEDRFPFDLEMFNRITKGGICKKTLNIAMAGVNVGKSLFLCHQAATSLKQGLNTLYITLEMAEEKIAERIDCNLMDISLDELYKIRKEDFTSKINALQSKTHGKLIVKEYPTGGAHVGHFKALLDELKMKKNFIPDIVFVDYMNICASQKYSGGANWNSYFAIKAISEELRGMAVEYNVPVWTCTQVNRGGLNNSDIEMSDISESTGPAMTGDFLFAIIRSEELDEIGQLMIKQLKSRYGDPNYYKRFVIGIDTNKFKLYNVENEFQKGISDPGKTDDVPVFDQSTFGKAMKQRGDVNELDFD